MARNYIITDLNDGRTFKAEFDNEATESQLEELKDWYASELDTYIDMIKVEAA